MKLTLFLCIALAWGLAAQDGNETDPITCFQPRASSSPNATAISAFVSPFIADACGYYASETANTTLVYNATGYSFVRVNIGDVPSDNATCSDAFAAILSRCVQDPADPMFGGMWTQNYTLTYLLANIAYPNNPLESSTLPPSQSPTITSAPSTGGQTTTAAASTTPPPVVGGGGFSSGEITKPVAEAIAATGLLLAVSWGGILAKPEAALALAAVNAAVSGMEPPTVPRSLSLPDSCKLRYAHASMFASRRSGGGPSSCLGVHQGAHAGARGIQTCWPPPAMSGQTLFWRVPWSSRCRPRSPQRPRWKQRTKISPAHRARSRRPRQAPRPASQHTWLSSMTCGPTRFGKPSWMPYPKTTRRKRITTAR